MFETIQHNVQQCCTGVLTAADLTFKNVKIDLLVVHIRSVTKEQRVLFATYTCQSNALESLIDTTKRYYLDEDTCENLARDIHEEALKFIEWHK